MTDNIELPQLSLKTVDKIKIQAAEQQINQQNKKEQKSFLEAIDVYQQDYKLLVNGQSTIKSVPGGIITILTIILFASAICFKIAYRNEGYGAYIVLENDIQDTHSINFSGRKLQVRNTTNTSTTVNSTNTTRTNTSTTTNSTSNSTVRNTTTTGNTSTSIVNSSNSTSNISQSNSNVSTSTNASSSSNVTSASNSSNATTAFNFSSLTTQQNNFMFVESNMDSFVNQNYTEPLNAFNEGIQSIRVIMNMQDRRNLIQHQMSQSYMPGVDPSTIRQLDLDSTRTALMNNISNYGQFLVLQVQPVFIPGAGNVSFDTSQMQTKFIGLETLQFTMDGDNYSVFPYIDITDQVFLMGDYFNTDYTQMKAYTKLQLKLDYYNVLAGALSAVQSWTSNQATAGGSVVSYDCSGSLIDYYPTYKEQLMTYFANMYSDHDAKFQQLYLSFSNEVDQFLTSDQSSYYMGGDRHPDAGPFYDGLNSLIKQCYNIYYIGNMSTSSYSVRQLFLQAISDQVVAVYNGLYSPNAMYLNGLMDSIAVQIIYDDPNLKPVTLGLDTLQFECANKSSAFSQYDPSTSTMTCTHYDKVIKFQVTEQYQQAVFWYGNQPFQAQPQVYMNSFIKYSSQQDITRYISVRQMPYFGAPPDTDFDVVWSMILTLEPQVKISTNVWFIQNQTQNASATNISGSASNSTNSSSVNVNSTTGKRLLKSEDSLIVEQDLTQIKYKQEFSVIGFLAWAGGLWFFISNMLVPFIMKKFFYHKEDLYGPDDLANQIFFSDTKRENELSQDYSIQSLQKEFQLEQLNEAQIAQSVEENPNCKQNEQEETPARKSTPHEISVEQMIKSNQVNI